MSRVAAIQMTSTAEVQHNLKIAAEQIQKAVDDGAKMLVLPEMFAIIGVSPDALLRVKEHYGEGQIQDFLAEQSARHHIWLVGGTIPLQGKFPNKATAACLVFNDQGICVAQYNKIHLFDVIAQENEVYQESATIEPGHEIKVVDTPLGKLGLAVCYDVRFPELFKILMNKGAEIIALPSAFTVPTGTAHWEILVRARAIDTFCYMVAPAQVGTHANGRKTYGHSLIVAPGGQILAEVAEKTGVISAEIELSKIQEIRHRIPILQHQRIRIDHSIL
jgi:predicted amidohydrolase